MNREMERGKVMCGTASPRLVRYTSAPTIDLSAAALSTATNYFCLMNREIEHGEVKCAMAGPRLILYVSALAIGLSVAALTTAAA